MCELAPRGLRGSMTEPCWLSLSQTFNPGPNLIIEDHAGESEASPVFFGINPAFGVVVATSPAFAQAVSSQAEWTQTYDAASRNSVARSSTPMLSAHSAEATEQAIERYRDIAARGGWEPVSPAARLKLGSRGPEVVALRRRLIQSGDLEPSGGRSPTSIDSYVEAAVRRFQARHGLNTTGALNASTVDGHEHAGRDPAEAARDQPGAAARLFGQSRQRATSS